MSVIAMFARLDEDGLNACRSNPDWLEALEAGEVRGAEAMDVDKACDGIVWLLSKLPPPPSASVEGDGFVLQVSLAPLLRGEGGQKEQKLDAPYGPALRLTPENVRELSRWIREIQPDHLRSRYNPRAMDADAVYPQIWSQEGEAAFDDYLLPHFQRLREFFSRAEMAKQQVIVCFT